MRFRAVLLSGLVVLIALAFLWGAFGGYVQGAIAGRFSPCDPPALAGRYSPCDPPANMLAGRSSPCPPIGWI